MNRRPFLTALALAGVMMTSCAAQPTRPAATPAPEIALQGVYVMTISKEDLSANKAVSEAEICENAGVFTYTLSAGYWNLIQTAAPGCTPVLGMEFDGDWKLSGNQMISHWKSAPGCVLDSTYAWKLEGTALSFTAVKDSCAPRVAIFTTHPWIKQK